ncbi:META domain-containing protein [Natronospirillum operosum]|uniref:META domain-containing protein n=2 Tax=Natronospirillum operosum TaxID=2759953 RepID=A0A4Z0WDL5_9GAMM|nr:META domain-containing protein [Natronospirillum operosum]
MPGFAMPQNSFPRSVASGLLLTLSLLAGCAGQDSATVLNLPADRSAMTTDSRGMLMYQADAAVFRECSTGQLFPVRMAGAWLETERRYLEARGESPAWVLAEGQATYEWAAPMEGPERYHLTFDDIPELTLGQFCGQSAEALLDQVWAVVHLDGFGLDRFADGHRPTVKLTADEDSAAGDYAVSGSTGCNQYGGQLTLSAEQMAFGSLVTTRMYCMNTADIEARFLDMTREAVRGSLEGDTWHWYDAEGRWLAALQASDR